MKVVGCRAGRWAVLGGGRGLAVVGFRFGCWWCRWHRLVCVGCVGWFLVGVRFGLRRDLCEGSTLAVQDLVCDGSRWVAVEGGAVGVVSSGW